MFGFLRGPPRGCHHLFSGVRVISDHLSVGVMLQSFEGNLLCGDYRKTVIFFKIQRNSPILHLSLFQLIIVIIRINKVKVMCGQVWCPIHTWEFVLCIYPSKCTHLTHTAVSSEQTTHSECERDLILFVVLSVEESTVDPCRYRDSNLQPWGYNSDSLTIKPRLPHMTLA